ncbi:MAG: molybdate ABC transporter substrate-binding protein [Desulfosarcina sp.]|nr:molybdate ABC transporter substrate-binding protein [Desulfobacterales bacterium]
MTKKRVKIMISKRAMVQRNRKILQKIKLFFTAMIVGIVLMAFDVYSQESHEILIFAGAGMREPLDKIGRAFEKKYNIKVLYDYEGSGRLGNKIMAGQRPDVYIPGAEQWAKLLKEKGYVKNYQAIALHVPVIITPHDNLKVNALHDFFKKEVKIVLGDSRVCAIGKATSLIFKNAGLDETKMNILAKGVTVKQIIYWVRQNNADAGLVWRADALQSSGLRIINISENINHIDMIPVCTMRTPEHPETALKYIKFILNKGRAQFKKDGFTDLKK